MSTSNNVYQIIKEQGLLSARRFEVYQALSVDGPMTQNEVVVSLTGSMEKSSSITPRFAELKRLGVIREVDERPCTVTGINCTVWETTQQLPLKLKTEHSKTSKIESLKSALGRAAEMAEKMGFVDDAKQFRDVLNAN